ncbi:phosphate signaling complex protein PhoU [Clostridium sp. Marseille-P299]|uniref:phosphate signaling complex protein PhoU n=1 Tax=Clostridium sp. Marseille-P299 TaxID=1805477 RepID=UPI00083311B6|nr:phosphate signaling complex protein PhoU [Clostridium sp. Marseille-P299]
MSARISFEHELEILNSNLEDMGNMIETAIDKVMRAFENHDEALALEIIKGDRTINDIEKAIESRCLSLILRQQPVAKDLRIVTTALKVVTDMERIGDHAADISELILRSKAVHTYDIIKPIPEMASVAKKMVHEAVAAFIHTDVNAARETMKMDDIVDELFNQVKSDVITHLKKSTEDADDCIDILMIAKYMERIGDHAVNICEWTEFHETGTVRNVRLL